MEAFKNDIIDLPIWVLNLYRDTNRRQFMEFQLQNLGLKFSIVEALDGNNLVENDLHFYSKKIALRDYGRELTSSELGCALSHIGMWQKLVDSEYDEVLILEDDVLIGRALIGVLRNRRKLPFGYQHINFSTKAKQLPFGEAVIDIYRASKHLENAYSTEAYLITKSGAQKLLSLLDPLYLPIDHFVCITDIVSYGIYPSIAISADFSSSIGRRGQYMPKVSFRQKKWRQFKQILKAVAIFFGVSKEALIKAHWKLNKIEDKLSQK